VRLVTPLRNKAIIFTVQALGSENVWSHGNHLVSLFDELLVGELVLPVRVSFEQFLILLVPTLCIVRDLWVNKADSLW